jgi:tetratricopeptide (TPR) repeat protein
LWSLGNLHFLLGEWSDARSLLERAVSVLRPLGPTYWFASSMQNLARLALSEGRWSDASLHIEEATTTAQQCNDFSGLEAAQILLAERELLQSQPRLALPRVESLLTHAGAIGEHRVWLLALLVQIHLEVGDLALAEKRVREASDAIPRQASDDTRLHLRQAEGNVAARRGRWRDAQGGFEEALALSRSLRHPLYEGRVLVDVGTMHSRKGEPHRAREQLGEALAIFQRLGASPYTEKAVRAVAGLSHN